MSSCRKCWSHERPWAPRSQEETGGARKGNFWPPLALPWPPGPPWPPLAPWASPGPLGPRTLNTKALYNDFLWVLICPFGWAHEICVSLACAERSEEARGKGGLGGRQGSQGSQGSQWSQGSQESQEEPGEPARACLERHLSGLSAPKRRCKAYIAPYKRLRS